MELNPGMTLSPVYLEIFSSAGRILVFFVAILAQIYLIARIRQTFRFPRRSAGFRSRAVAAAGTAVVLLFALGGYVMATPISWVDPPRAVQLLIFYLPAVWVVGSISSALILILFRGAGDLGRRASRIHRERTGKPVDAVVDTGRRRFLQAGAGALAVAPFVLSGYGAAYAGRAHEVRELALPFGRTLQGGSAHRHPRGAFHDPAGPAALCRPGQRPAAGSFRPHRGLHHELNRLSPGVRRGDGPGQRPLRYLRHAGQSRSLVRRVGRVDGHFPAAPHPASAQCAPGHPYPGGALRRCRHRRPPCRANPTWKPPFAA